MFERVKTFFLTPFTRKQKYIAAIICMVFVLWKLLLYYDMLSIHSYLLGTVGVTLFILVTCFLVFKRKALFIFLYFLFSILMIADVTYYGFFNRYLSVNMLGAAKLLGDVSESVFEILNPVSFFLLLDVVIITLVYFILWLNQKKACYPARPEEPEDWWNKPISDEMKVKMIAITFVLVAGLTVMNPVGDHPVSAVGNQEFFAYHLRDVSGMMEKAEGNNMDSIGNILAIVGDYDKEKEGEEFGVGEGMNLIVIQVEAMQNFVIGREYHGQEITPNINALLKEDTYYFDHYYQQLGSGNTSDAEFATNNSLFGTMKTYTYSLYEDNYFRGLPVLLKEKGYSTLAVHAYEKGYWNRENAYPGQGFDAFYSQDDFKLDDILGMGLSDSSMFRQTSKILEEENQPFYAFVVTLSSHHPFYVTSDLDIKEKDYGIFGDYLQSMHYVDKAVGELIEQLKEAGLYENTIIALYGDHFGMNPKDDEVQPKMSRFLEREYDYVEALNIPMFIHVPGSGESKTVSVPGGQIDFMPTIAYLMGFETLDTIHFGHNLLTVKENFVPIRAYIQRGSFVSGDIMFQMANNRIFSDGKAYNIHTGEEVDASRLKELYVKSVQLTNTSDYYLEQDILRQIYLEGKSLFDLIGTGESEEGQETSYDTAVIDGSAVEGENAGIYCLENLNTLYEQGYRAIRLGMLWTEDGRTVIMKDKDDVGRYFTREREVYTYDQFVKDQGRYQVKGTTSMTVEDLAAWLQEHPDVKIFLELRQQVLGEAESWHSIYWMRGIKDGHPEILNQLIFILETSEEVERANLEGLSNVIFWIEEEKYSEEQLLDFAVMYQIYAIAIKEEELNRHMNLWAALEGKIYLLADHPFPAEELERKHLAGVILE